VVGLAVVSTSNFGFLRANSANGAFAKQQRFSFRCGVTATALGRPLV
jgi:hypothetical protein